MKTSIFIINMKPCESRWYEVQKRLKDLNISAERFEATIGKNLGEQEFLNWYCPKKNKNSYHRNLTLGEIGCYISHMRVWEHIVTHSIPICVILEDDIIIKSHLTNTIESAEKLKNWDLIKLSDSRDLPFINTQSLESEFVLGNYFKIPNGAQGYILSLEGAKKLLHRKPFFRPVDVDMQFHSEVGLNIVGIKPYPIATDSQFESEIAKTNSGRHSNKSTFIRNLKHRLNLHMQRKKISANLSMITRKL